MSEVFNIVSVLAEEVGHGGKWLFWTTHSSGYADSVLATVLIWFGQLEDGQGSGIVMEGNCKSIRETC